MLSNDAIALDSLLDARLTFTHSSGAVENKPAYLSKMRQGRITYRAIQWSDQVTVQLNPENVLLMGSMTVDVLVDALEKRLENRVIEVWTQIDQDWKLLAFQSTPIK